MKFHIQTRLSKSFLMMYRFWKCSKKSCTSHQFTPYANWNVTKGCFHPFGGSWSFERGTLRKLHTGLGVGQIWTACNSRLRKNSVSHVFWLVQTCPNLSEPVRNTVAMYGPSHDVFFSTFGISYSSVLRPSLVKLHILTRLMKSFPMVYELWRCIEVKLSIPLGAHA